MYVNMSPLVPMCKIDRDIENITLLFLQNEKLDYETHNQKPYNAMAKSRRPVHPHCRDTQKLCSSDVEYEPRMGIETVACVRIKGTYLPGSNTGRVWTSKLD